MRAGKQASSFQQMITSLTDLKGTHTMQLSEKRKILTRRKHLVQCNVLWNEPNAFMHNIRNVRNIMIFDQHAAC